MTYKFKYKKGWFWKTETIIGHQLQIEANRMDLFYADGTILSVGGWDQCDLSLGKDWIEYTKAQMEEESGADIKLRRGVGE